VKYLSGQSVEIVLELPSNWSELVASRTEHYKDHTQKQLQRVVIDMLGRVSDRGISAGDRGSAFLDLHVALLLLTKFWK